MHSLFVYECLLDGVRVVRRTQTLDGKDAVTCTIRDCRGARANRLAVQQDSAAAALTEAAAEFWSVEFQVFLQNVQQGSGRIVHAHRIRTTVHRQTVCCHLVLLLDVIARRCQRMYDSDKVYTLARWERQGGGIESPFSRDHRWWRALENLGAAGWMLQPG